MNDEVSALRPAEPHTRRIGLRAVFAVVGGPAAWYLQLCAGYWLADGPCYPGHERLLVPAASLSWTWPLLIALLVVCAVIALVAFAVSRSIWLEMRAVATAAPDSEGPPAARVRFMAFWGMVFGGGFFVATLTTIAAYATLPRCAG
jgi:hypothetical protein